MNEQLEALLRQIMHPETGQNIVDSGFVDRARGTGRPTKKDRRSMEEFIAPEYFSDDEDFDFDFEE